MILKEAGIMARLLARGQSFQELLSRPKGEKKFSLRKPLVVQQNAEGLSYEGPEPWVNDRKAEGK